jgi:RNA polymerase sigma-70 factor (sigma-E family)
MTIHYSISAELGRQRREQIAAGVADVPAEPDFAAFVAAHSNSLYRTAYLLTGDRDRAQDALQTALLRIYRAWSWRASWENPEGYAHQVVTRVVLSSARRRWWGERPTADLPEQEETGSRASIEAVDERDALRRALLALPVKQRSAVVLRYYVDMPETKVAAVMQCPVGSVKSLTSRGLQALRVQLGEPSSMKTRELVS